MADAPLVVGDVIEVRFEGYIGSNRWNNVRHFAITTAPADPTDIYGNLRALAEELNDLYYAAVKEHLCNQWVHSLTRVKRIRPTPSVFALHADPQVGDVTGDYDEPDDAVVVRLYTSQAGRSHQGRMYLAGLADADVTLGMWSEAKALLLRADLTDLFSTFHTITGGMAVHGYVWSKKLSDDGDPLTQAAWPITLVVVDRVVRRQTRRDISDPVLIGS